MRTKSIRIPDDLEAAVRYVADVEKIEAAQSLRKLARVGFECYVAKRYAAGALTLREAAALLGRPLSEALDLFEGLGIGGNIRGSDVLDSLRSLG